MNMYLVEFTATIEVKAEDEDEAYDRAFAELNKEDLYSYIRNATRSDE